MKTHTLSVCLIAVMLLTCCAISDAAPLQAGAAKRVVTPDPLLPVSGGVGTPNPSNKALGDLFMRALVLEKDGLKIAILGTDFLGFPMVLGDKIRAKVNGIPAENILIGATHSHSAPDTYGFPDEKGKSHVDLKYLDWVCEQGAAAINEALDALEAVNLKSTVREAKGKIAYNYYAPQLYDPRCGVLQFHSRKTAGKIVATLVNYASHPEVIGAGQGIISPDFCGPLYDYIEKETGGMAIYMNGAQGGMVTADCRGEDGDIQTWEECVRIGELLGSEALRMIERAKVQEDPVLYCTHQAVTFPIDSKLMRRVFKLSPLAFAQETQDISSIETRVNLINLGKAQILTIPGEALPNIGYYIKRHMPTRHAFLFGLTNDAFGYMLAKVDFRSFKRYDYISFTSLGEMTGEIYMEEALNLVAKSPKPDATR